MQVNIGSQIYNYSFNEKNTNITSTMNNNTSTRMKQGIKLVMHNNSFKEETKGNVIATS